MSKKQINYESKFTKLEWISAMILQKPRCTGGRVKKGVIVLSMADEIVSFFPYLRKYFYIVEWRGWKGINCAENVDLKLVEDSSTMEETRKRFPSSISLDIALGDFVDTDKFKPLHLAEKIYTGVQIVSWKDFKRHQLFLEAAAFLPKKRFLKFGHFPNETIEEIELKKRILNESSKLEAKIEFPYRNLKTNKGLPNTPEKVNDYINSAKMGILTSAKEGVNRFKMECLAIDIPFLVPADSCSPIKKHINKKTGIIYKATPKGLAEAILYVESNLQKFSPRSYILEKTGRLNSSKKLESALNELAVKDGYQPYFNNLIFDGRNQSFSWGAKAIELIKEYVRGKNG